MTSQILTQQEVWAIENQTTYSHTKWSAKTNDMIRRLVASHEELRKELTLLSGRYNDCNVMILKQEARIKRLKEKLMRSSKE